MPIDVRLGQETSPFKLLGGKRISSLTDPTVSRDVFLSGSMDIIEHFSFFLNGRQRTDQRMPTRTFYSQGSGDRDEPQRSQPSGTGAEPAGGAAPRG